MSLNPGTRLGPYEIVAPIGAGGMGEVCRATDTNLKRSVAIKVLPAAVAADADRLARFQREAEVLAALNHPNIAAIYGLEKTPDLTALVMELVEGEDLSAHISRGALPLSDALAIARQIADALEAAHENGIIHRDLKPANIKVRADGTVKVLDFGLAKAMDPTEASGGAAMNSPTMTNRATQMGLILGTAAYMAGDPSSKPEKFLATDATESQPQLSSDGRWLAYVSTEGGGPKVTVRQFPSGPGFVRVGSGAEPRWKKDGSELYFLTSRNQGSDLSLMAVSVNADGQSGISAGTPVRLFDFESLVSIVQNNSWLYAPSPDGQRFLVSVRAESGPPTIHVLTNWLKAARDAGK